VSPYHDAVYKKELDAVIEHYRSLDDDEAKAQYDQERRIRLKAVESVSLL